VHSTDELARVGSRDYSTRQFYAEQLMGFNMFCGCTKYFSSVVFCEPVGEEKETCPDFPQHCWILENVATGDELGSSSTTQKRYAKTERISNAKNLKVKNI
jgi:hypothetical protein